jgi:hypothetical protein
LVLASLGFLYWRPLLPSVSFSVSGAAARTESTTLRCNETATITATLKTNGQAGKIDYRWIRSDGTVSERLHQAVTQGSRHVNVVLRWKFTGSGTYQAAATIEVLSPQQISASVAFPYICRHSTNPSRRSNENSVLATPAHRSL